MSFIINNAESSTGTTSEKQFNLLISNINA
jgi:hypothetical protein